MLLPINVIDCCCLVLCSVLNVVTYWPKKIFDRRSVDSSTTVVLTYLILLFSCSVSYLTHFWGESPRTAFLIMSLMLLSSFFRRLSSLQINGCWWLFRCMTEKLFRRKWIGSWKQLPSVVTKLNHFSDAR